jgi:hypothetical protein
MTQPPTTGFSFTDMMDAFMPDARPTRPCACGCDETVYVPTVYRPGHDTRHRGRLIDLIAGDWRTTPAVVRARRIDAWIAALEDRP